jgi:hypothetical protein
MVASTVKDLNDMRDALWKYLKDSHYEVWMSEKPGFPTHFHPDAMTNCVIAAEHCDHFVLLLDKRAGLPFKRTGITVTEAEYRKARERNKRLSIFVRATLDDQSKIYRQLRRDERRKRKWYADHEVFEFYDRLMHEREAVPFRHTFNDLDDIANGLQSDIEKDSEQNVNYPIEPRMAFGNVLSRRDGGHLLFVYGHGRHRPEKTEDEDEYVKREIEAQIWKAVLPVTSHEPLFNAGHKRIRAPDLDTAFSLAAKIGWVAARSSPHVDNFNALLRIRGMSDLFLEDSPEMKSVSNIVSIGAGDSNVLTARVQNSYYSKLKVRFNAIQDSAYIESLAGGRRQYQKEEQGMLAFLKSPFNSRKLLILAAGVGSLGTSAALLALLKEKDDSAEHLSVWDGNKYDKQCHQRVVEATGFDDIKISDLTVRIVKEFRFLE